MSEQSSEGTKESGGWASQRRGGEGEDFIKGKVQGTLTKTESREGTVPESFDICVCSLPLETHFLTGIFHISVNGHL